MPPARCHQRALPATPPGGEASRAFLRTELAHMAGDRLPAPVKCSWGPAASSDSFPLTPARPLACYWATGQHPETHRQNLTGRRGWPHHYSSPARRAVANLAHAGNARIQGRKVLRQRSQKQGQGLGSSLPGCLQQFTPLYGERMLGSLPGSRVEAKLARCI